MFSWLTGRRPDPIRASLNRVSPNGEANDLASVRRSADAQTLSEFGGDSAGAESPQPIRAQLALLGGLPETEFAAAVAAMTRDETNALLGGVSAMDKESQAPLINASRTSASSARRSHSLASSLG